MNTYELTAAILAGSYFITTYPLSAGLLKWAGLIMAYPISIWILGAATSNSSIM